jgi:hypothetical protein|nr:MAG: hypothetical protein KatS3mg041_0426 [Bacteroidota bacterium]
MVRWGWILAGALLVLLLVLTNPNQERFARFASEQVESWALQHIPAADTHRAQSLARGLGFLATVAAERQNFGILSLYSVDLSPYTGHPTDRWRFLGILGRFIALKRPPEPGDRLPRQRDGASRSREGPG